MSEYELDRVTSLSFSNLMRPAEAQLAQIKKPTNKSLSVVKDIIFKIFEICEILDIKDVCMAAFTVTLSAYSLRRLVAPSLAHFLAHFLRLTTANVASLHQSCPIGFSISAAGLHFALAFNYRVCQVALIDVTHL